MTTYCTINHFKKIIKSFKKNLQKKELYNETLLVNVPYIEERTDLLFNKLEKIFNQTVQGQNRKNKSRFTDNEISAEYLIKTTDTSNYIVITYRFTKNDNTLSFFGELNNGTHRVHKQIFHLGK
jgi:hypothetical protein